MTIQSHLRRLSARLGQHQARMELQWMRTALNDAKKRQFPLPDLGQMVERRIAGEPLQYILGDQPFGPLSLRVRSPVLIPRPETEHWALRVASRFQPSIESPISVLDLCTGSGCIPLLLCKLWPSGTAKALGVDISDDAVNLAKENAILSGLSESNPSKNVFRVQKGDLFASDFAQFLRDNGGPFDLVTANPPYIPPHEYEALDTSVKEYEDKRALLGNPPGEQDPSGLAFYRRIASLATTGHLIRSGGSVVMEVGDGQNEEVRLIFERLGGASLTKQWDDPWGKARVVVATFV